MAIDEIHPCISPFGSLRGPNLFQTDLSCKGRGICPSCNTRRMAETAAHRVDPVFPQVPVRQWVLSFPKRLRYFLARDADRLNRVLRIFLDCVETALHACCPDAPEHARLGAVTFVHRLGSALNGHIHFHGCVIDGLLSAKDEAVYFREATLTPEMITGVQAQVRERILRLFKRRELLAPEVVEAMREWDPAGDAHDAHPCASPDGRLSAVQIGYPADLSLHADVTVPASDRSGLERLFRYCARPIFASERLQWIEKDQRLIDRLPKPRLTGQTILTLTPLEFLDKWALLMARIYEILPLVCPQCGGEMEIIAFITEADPIQRVLNHIGEPTTPPLIAPARAPPESGDADFNQSSLHESEQTEPVPEFEYDQTVTG